MNTLRQLQRASLLPRLEQAMLWEYVLGVSRAWLIAHDTDTLPDVAVQRYQQLEQRRLQGEPMAYLIGWREFMGHRFSVSPAVLIPRPDTEVLVEQALHVIAGLQQPRVLDLGTGSGAIAISIALARPDAVVVASDFSIEAITLAQKNAHDLCGKVEFLTGSWYDVLDGHAPFDLIVSNPPYIAHNDPHLQQGDVRFEPKQALTDGASGLADLQTIISGATTHLRPAGQLWVEHGWDQAEQVRSMLHHAGYSAVSSKQDLAGIERISGGTR
ncbi:MAG TPA: peptide chain release factor N(5)-glutamine methyltransferase [Paenalcaligenes sp.]|nr:peptide chain release factor N(5)-glutamine methyltransferase [Paenalcaligenes sp.]